MLFITGFKTKCKYSIVKHCFLINAIQCWNSLLKGLMLSQILQKYKCDPVWNNYIDSCKILYSENRIRKFDARDLY